uniref:Uncharacterized protein n=1 Tax=Kryptolebias marmoratus TaxID=37003 RepID=A0A3Q3BBR2_KRYMA
MDSACNGIKKTECSDLAVNPRPPPAKLARLEQHRMGSSTPEKRRPGSPVAKTPCQAQKPITASGHTKGTRSYRRTENMKLRE